MPIPYNPDPTDPTEPTLLIDAGTAAAEFRALKAYIQTVLATAGIGGLNFLRKNLIMNGDMSVDQRYEGNLNPYNIYQGITGSPNSGNAWIIDRWFGVGGTTSGAAGQVKTQQLVSTLGAGSEFMLDYQVVNTGVNGSTDVWLLQQGIEGTDIGRLLYGTALAKSISLSFLVSSQTVGTHCFSLRNGAGTRSYVGTFNIPVANTPTYITVNNIPGDTGGVWVNNTNCGMILTFDMGSGSILEAPITNAWQNGNYTRIAGAVKPISAAGHFKLSLVQLEQSAAATQFEFLMPNTQLSNCRRFMCKSYQSGRWFGAASTAIVDATTAVDPGAGAIVIPVKYPARMRAAPTVYYTDINGTGIQNPPGTLANVTFFLHPTYSGGPHTLVLTPTYRVDAAFSAADWTSYNFLFPLEGIAIVLSTTATAGNILGVCWYAEADFFVQLYH